MKKIITEQTKKDILIKALMYYPEIQNRGADLEKIFSNMPDINIDGPIAVLDWIEKYLISLKEK